MIKLKVFIILLLFSVQVFSQEKEMSGAITNTKDVGGIHIRNQTTPDNAVTHADGSFKINASINDTLLVSAISYKPQKLVVSDSIYKQSTLLITLEELVNELDEVKLASKLSKEERAQLKTVKEDLQKDLSWEKMEFEYEFTQDKYSSIEGNKAHDAFFNGQKQNDGVKLHKIIPAVIKFLKRKDTDTPPQLSKDVVRYFIKQKYTKEDLQSYFEISPEYAEDFLYFLVDEGVPDTFIEESSVLELTQFISEKASLYNAKAKE